MLDEINKILTPEEIQKIESWGVELHSDLLDPKVDTIFKAMFTSRKLKSQKALAHFLSAALRRNIAKAELMNNELANDGVFQKQSAFDIHVKFDEGDEADIEMQMKLTDSLVNRSEYNTAKLFSSQNIKGALYADLKNVYTVMITNFTLFDDRVDFFDEYMYRNAEGRILSGKTKIIYVELTKLKETEKKPVSEMTGIEKWALFLKYANKRDKHGLISEIVKSEEGIRMGVEMLETISKDRKEFSRYWSRLKAEIDRESQFLYEYRKGKTEGKAEGKAEGLAEGLAKGQIKSAVNIIKELRITVTKAMEITKLAEENREELLRELENQKIIYSL